MRWQFHFETWNFTKSYIFSTADIVVCCRCLIMPRKFSTQTLVHKVWKYLDWSSVYNVVIVVCGFWYKPHFQAIIFRMTKAIPLLMYTQYSHAFFLYLFILYRPFPQNVNRFSCLFFFSFRKIRSLSWQCIKPRLRFEWGRKWFQHWNDLKSTPTYIHDIFCFQFWDGIVRHRTKGWHNLAMKCKCMALFAVDVDCMTAANRSESASSVRSSVTETEDGKFIFS